MWFFITVITIFLCNKLWSEHRRSKGVQIENIRAQLMLASNDCNEVECFLLAKEPYITRELVQKLIERILELKTDESLGLKWRVEAPAIAMVDNETISINERVERKGLL